MSKTTNFILELDKKIYDEARGTSCILLLGEEEIELLSEAIAEGGATMYKTVVNQLTKTNMQITCYNGMLVYPIHMETCNIIYNVISKET